jgi:hypothetical protein
VLNVLGLLVELEPAATALLDRICGGPLIDAASLPATRAKGGTVNPNPQLDGM